MKSQKGVTLISLTIYVIAMVVVVALMTTIGTFFFENIKDATKKVEVVEEYTKFNRIFSEETTHSNLKVLDWDKTDKSYIIFDNGVQYSFIKENKSIYKDKVKVCRGIDYCTFEYKIQGGKNAVIVTIRSGNEEKMIKYILKD